MLTVDEVAKELRIARNTVYALISAGTLPALRVGKKLFRIRREDLEKAFGVQKQPAQTH